MVSNILLNVSEKTVDRKYDKIFIVEFIYLFILFFFLLFGMFTFFHNKMFKKGKKRAFANL